MIFVIFSRQDESEVIYVNSFGSKLDRNPDQIKRASGSKTFSPEPPMSHILSLLQPFAILLDFARTITIAAFYISGWAMILIVLLSILYLLGKIIAAGWVSFRDGIKSEPVLTSVLTVSLVFFSSTLLFAALAPQQFTATMRGLVFM
jgi:cation transport ATPase